MKKTLFLCLGFGLATGCSPQAEKTYVAVDPLVAPLEDIDLAKCVNDGGEEDWCTYRDNKLFFFKDTTDRETVTRVLRISREIEKCDLDAKDGNERKYGAKARTEEALALLGSKSPDDLSTWMETVEEYEGSYAELRGMDLKLITALRELEDEPIALAQLRKREIPVLENNIRAVEAEIMDLETSARTDRDDLIKNLLKEKLKLEKSLKKKLEKAQEIDERIAEIPGEIDSINTILPSLRDQDVTQRAKVREVAAEIQKRNEIELSAPFLEGYEIEDTLRDNEKKSINALRELGQIVDFISISSSEIVLSLDESGALVVDIRGFSLDQLNSASDYSTAKGNIVNAEYVRRGGIYKFDLIDDDGKIYQFEMAPMTEDSAGLKRKILSGNVTLKGSDPARKGKIKLYERRIEFIPQ